MEKEQQADLVLKVNAEPTIPIGFAKVYRCSVIEVLKGKLDMKTIFVTVLSGDNSNEELFSQKTFPKEFKIGFNKKNENEPYSTATVTGFVDSENTSWEITYISD